MSKYTEDKERVDKITELIANQEPVKEWVVMYWLAVAVGHILEWIVKQQGNATPDPDQAANDLPEKKRKDGMTLGNRHSLDSINRAAGDGR